jgi:hypothetical protein
MSWEVDGPRDHSEVRHKSWYMIVVNAGIWFQRCINNALRRDLCQIGRRAYKPRKTLMPRRRIVLRLTEEVKSVNSRPIPIHCSPSQRKCAHYKTDYLSISARPLYVGAACHRSGQSLSYLARKRIDVLEAWPPYSPDLNMIEKLWAKLNRRVAELGPVDMESLRSCIKKAWEGITQAEIDAICGGFRSRVEEVFRTRANVPKPLLRVTIRNRFFMLCTCVLDFV